MGEFSQQAILVAAPIIIFLIYCSRWVRAVSCRVAAHETDSSGDFDDVGLIGTL